MAGKPQFRTPLFLALLLALVGHSHSADEEPNLYTVECTDDSTVCTAFSECSVVGPYSLCRCDDGYANYDDECKIYHTYGSACDPALNMFCLDDATIECIEGTCQCANGLYEDGQGSCISEESVESLGISCGANDDCTHLNAQCIAEECTCVGGAVANEDSEKCVYEVGVDSTCNDDMVCSDPFSECKDSNYLNGGSKMCRCIPMYIFYEGFCRQQRTTAEDETCYTCINNGGHCVEMDGSTACSCPGSQTGTNCEDRHLTVECHIQDFRMTMCFEAFPGENITDTSMYTTGNTGVMDCTAVLAEKTNSQRCPDGQLQLNLDLENAQTRALCGVIQIQEINTLKYEATLVVVTIDNTYNFDAFCEYRSTHNAPFSGLASAVNPVNDQGQHFDVDIELRLLNIAGGQIEGLVNPGDPIIFEAEIINTDTYGALQVEECIVSTSYKVPDQDAITLKLIVDSCPVSGQAIIDSANNFFRPYAEKPYILRTGEIEPFILREGDMVYLHCRIKICIANEINQCDMEPCDNGGSGKRRRRSAASTQEATFSVEMPWKTEMENDKSVTVQYTNFVILITFLVLFLIGSLVLATVLVWRRLRRHKVVDDSSKILAVGGAQPQRFALPRMPRAEMRL